MVRDRKIVTRRTRSIMGSTDQERVKNLCRNSRSSNSYINNKQEVVITFTDTLNPMTNLETIYHVKLKDYIKYASKGLVRRLYEKKEKRQR